MLLVLFWRILRSPGVFGRLDCPAVALLACAALPELLDCVPSADKTAAGDSYRSHGAKYSADIELGQGKSPFKIARTNPGALTNRPIAVPSDSTDFAGVFDGRLVCPTADIRLSRPGRKFSLSA